MNRRPKMYMLCGVPGSGKSTFVKSVLENNKNVHIASTDNLIEMAALVVRKSYNEVFQDTIKDATKTMYRLISLAIAEDQDIIWDQTNLDHKSRMKKLIMIPDHYEKIAVYFPVPDDLHERLIQRELSGGKSIPDVVLQNMIKSFEVPGEFEGFDRITHIKDMDHAELSSLQDA